MPNPKMRLGTFRVEEDLWQAAQAEAERRGETVSEAVRRMLRRYADHPDFDPRWKPAE